MHVFEARENTEPNAGQTAEPAPSGMIALGDGEEDAHASRIPVWTVHLLWLPMAAALVCLMLRYSVDIPTTNQWDFEIPFLMQVWKGNWSLSDFIAQNFEYRPAIERVVAFLAMRFFRYNIPLQVFLNWVAVVILMVNLCTLAFRSLPRTFNALAPPVFLTALAVFSLSQYEIFLDAQAAWCEVWVFITTGVVLAGSRARESLRLGGCILLALLSSYSVVVGLFAWVILLPPLVPGFSWDAYRRKSRLVAVWLAAAFFTIGLYAWNYQRPALTDVPSMQVDPGVFVRFLLSYLGVAFAQGTAFDPLEISMWCGVGIVLLYGAILRGVWLARRDERFVERVKPWLVFAAMGFATALATTVGRAGFGVPRAISSRYVNQNVLTMVSLFFLIPILLHQRKICAGELGGLGARIRPLTWPAAASAVVVFLYVNASVHAMGAFRSWRINWLTAKAAMLYTPCFAEDQILKIWWHKTAEEMKPRLEFLDENGFLQPKLIRDKRISTLVKKEVVSPHARERIGALDHASSPAQNVVQLAGWATHPDDTLPADAVLLTWEKSSGEAEVFGVAQMGIPREDIAAKWGKHFRLSGWGKIFPASVLPRGPVTLKAWSLNTDSGSVTELQGSIQLNNP